MPLLGLYLVVKFSKLLEDNEYHSDPTIYKQLLARFKLRLGFLTQGYKPEYFYWEIILLLRKTLLVLILTFFEPYSSGFQSLLAMCLFTISIILHLYKDPYYDKKLNNLETLSLTTQMSIIYFGIYY